MMNENELKIGLRVYFGRNQGEKTLGEIVKINRARCKVKTLESRGTFKDHPIGAVWTVPFSLLSPAPQDAQPSALDPMAAEIARLKAENERLRQAAKPKRPEAEILREIDSVYGRLSPENLTCDGELSGSEIRRRSVALNARLRELFTELGREVSESECYRHLEGSPE